MATAFNLTNDTQNETIDMTSMEQQTGEYIPIYDYFDINDRITWMLNTPQQVFPLIIGTIAIVANLLCAAAIIRVRQRWTNLFRFMCSLMMSDILVALSVMAHVINWVVNPLYYSGIGPWNERIKSRCAFIIIKALNTMGLNVTLLNLMAMAVDHYVAIMCPLHYSTVLNIKRSRIIIISIWLSAFVTAFSDMTSPLWTTAQHRSSLRLNYCETVWLSQYQEEYTTFVIAAICFCMMFTIYLKIYWSIRGKHRNSIVYQTRDGKVRDKNTRNTRALLTTLLILGTFALCWVPMCLFQIILIIIIRVNRELLAPDTISTLTTIDQYLYAAVLINTLCDPIIYAIRIGEVRHGILLMIAKCLPQRLRQKIIKSSYEGEQRTSNHSISLLAERRGTMISGVDEPQTLSASEHGVLARDSTQPDSQRAPSKVPANQNERIKIYDTLTEPLKSSCTE